MIDLYSNNVWSERDIVAHTEALVHQTTSITDENILNRKLAAQGMGLWTMTQSEQDELQAYAAACNAAHQAGIQMRADNALLQSALDYEAALQLIEEPDIDEVDVDGVTVNQDAIDSDIAEREIALIVINTASQATIDLYALRNPEPEPVIEPEPTPEPGIPE